MECPKCKLINPASAMQCDCGYVFSVKILAADVGKYNKKWNDTQTEYVNEYKNVIDDKEKNNDGSVILKYANGNKRIHFYIKKVSPEKIYLYNVLEENLVVEIDIAGEMQYYYLEKHSIDEYKYSHKDIIIADRIKCEYTKEDILDKLSNVIKDIKPKDIKGIIERFYHDASNK